MHAYKIVRRKKAECENKKNLLLFILLQTVEEFNPVEWVQERIGNRLEPVVLSRRPLVERIPLVHRAIHRSGF